jgi:hypothetical protein
MARSVNSFLPRKQKRRLNAPPKNQPSDFYSGRPECLAASIAHERLHATIWGNDDKGDAARVFPYEFSSTWTGGPSDFINLWPFAMEEDFIDGAVDSNAPGHGCFKCRTRGPRGTMH